MFVSVRMWFHNHVDQGLKHAAHDAFWEFSYNQNLSFLVYSPMFKSARPASEQVFF